MDRGTKSEIIWTIPYYLQEKTGELTPRFFANRSLKDLEEILRSLPLKPRYITDAPRTLKELSQMVIREFNSDVSRIWQNKTASYVKSTFRRVYGVGPGIASMIVLLLERCFRIHFTDIDHKTMDVKPDVHIIRVFQRLGLTLEPNAEEALRAARQFSPAYPGALDAPTWVIGKRWCTPYEPRCENCPLHSVCPKSV